MVSLKEPHLIDLTWYHRNVHDKPVTDTQMLQLSDFLVLSPEDYSGGGGDSYEVQELI